MDSVAFKTAGEATMTWWLLSNLEFRYPSLFCVYVHTCLGCTRPCAKVYTETRSQQLVLLGHFPPDFFFFQTEVPPGSRA